VIVLKSAREIALMRRAGHILAGVVERLRGFVRPGMSTLEIDEDVEAYIHREGAAPAFKGYRGFPATVCISINEEVVHGIPSPRRKSREGDIVGLDLGCIRGTRRLRVHPPDQDGAGERQKLLIRQASTWDPGGQPAGSCRTSHTGSRTSGQRVRHRAGVVGHGIDGATRSRSQPGIARP
jgi:methionine aminopeptidase